MKNKPETPCNDVDGGGRVLPDGVTHFGLDVGKLRVKSDSNDGKALASGGGKSA